MGSLPQRDSPPPSIITTCDIKGAVQQITRLVPKSKREQLACKAEFREFDSTVASDANAVFDVEVVGPKELLELVIKKYSEEYEPLQVQIEKV